MLPFQLIETGSDDFMPSLNFKPQFVEAIEQGRKRQTIRKLRKRPFKAGDTLYLFTQMRTAGCRRIGRFTCTQVKAIRIEPRRIFIEDALLNDRQRHRLAQADGFADVAEMMHFFSTQHQLPFVGQIIYW